MGASALCVCRACAYVWQTYVCRKTNSVPVAKMLIIHTNVSDLFCQEMEDSPIQAFTLTHSYNHGGGNHARCAQPAHREQIRGSYSLDLGTLRPLTGTLTIGTWPFPI